METIFQNLLVMLFSAFLTLIVPFWLLPITMGAGLLMLMRVLRDVKAQKTPTREGRGIFDA
jgi:hypothetical protein